MKEPLVSVIVPTFNSSEFLEACLQSIKDQTYKNIELIVVDNNSTDTTKEIAKKFTKNVFNKGPERSAQVNYGATKAKGEFVYKVDSDFVLDKAVVSECVSEISKGYDAIVVHNTPDETVSWIAKIRKFEVDMYKYDLTHSSARFVKKDVYESIDGFNEKITAGEDYDFQNKLTEQGYKTGFIEPEALHLGEPKILLPHLKKMYFYGRDFVNYAAQNPIKKRTKDGFFSSVYFRNWRKFLRHPVASFQFIAYHLLKYTFGFIGYLTAKIHPKGLDDIGEKIPGMLGISDTLGKINFNDSCLIGYYGGGNYGDELLLEILQNKIFESPARMTVLYRNVKSFDTYHHYFGFRVIDQSKSFQSLYTLLKSKSVIIGGGGIWGMDANNRILALSVLLFLLRLLGKKIYLIGVGYYSSTNLRGRVGAFFASKSAALIAARDKESYQLFSRLSRKTHLSNDISTIIPSLRLNQYEKEARAIEKSLNLPPGPITFISFRRFESDKGIKYEDAVVEFINRHNEINFILSIFQPPNDFPEGMSLIRKLEKKPNVFFMDTRRNPLAIYCFFRINCNRVAFITPQFHSIITAIQNNIPFLPVVYDNKVEQLLLSVKHKQQPINIESINIAYIERFASKFLTRGGHEIHYEW